MTLKKRSLLLTTAAAALSAGIATARATPADDIAAMLDSPEFGGSIRYETVIDQVDGGVDIINLQLTPIALIEAGILTYPDQEGGRFVEPLEDLPAVVTVGRLHLDFGLLGLITDMPGDAAPNSLGFSLEDFEIDLAAMSGADQVDLLRRYIGDTAMVTGSASLYIESNEPGWYDINARANLDSIGSVILDVQFDETSQQPPRGTIAFTAVDNHALAGLGAYLQRIPVEMTLLLAEQTLEQSRENSLGDLLGDPDMDDPIIALLEAEIADSRAELARYPVDGDAAAAAIATWADAMTIALPDQTAFFAAIHAFAETAGTLTLDLAPAAGAIPNDAGFVLDFYNDPGLVEGVIDALGLTASFAAAE